MTEYFCCTMRESNSARRTRKALRAKGFLFHPAEDKLFAYSRLWETVYPALLVTSGPDRSPAGDARNFVAPASPRCFPPPVQVRLKE